MDTSKLAAETCRVWEFLAERPELAGFTLIGGVKVNLFIPDPDLAGMIEHRAEPKVRVAALPELFRTKALAAANRNVSRDWIDLYVLCRDHGFTVGDFASAFRRPAIHDPAAMIDHAFNNLCRGVAHAGDPGYEMLMPNVPSLPELAKFFEAMRDNYQIMETKRAFGSDTRPDNA